LSNNQAFGRKGDRFDPARCIISIRTLTPASSNRWYSQFGQ
jgi:hypothetical protein